MYRGCLGINISFWTLNYFNQKCLSRVQQITYTRSSRPEISSYFRVILVEVLSFWSVINLKPVLRFFLLGCGLQICHLRWDEGTARVWTINSLWGYECILTFLGNANKRRRNRRLIFGEILEGLWPLISHRSQKPSGFDHKATHAM